mgnify:CR=1 FL=1
MSFNNIIVESVEGITTITFNRPKALNALDTRTVRELGEMLTEVEGDRTLRALVLTGGGEKAFVAGADIAEMSKLSPLDARRFAEAGVLVSYGPSFPETFRQSATYVDKILKGAKPADLPVQQPTTIEFVINRKTAKAIGVTIPQPLLLGADAVI